jgi:hypothetical protein
LGNRESYLRFPPTHLISDVGDWEYLRLRTINGSAVSVDYRKSALKRLLIIDSHNGGAFSSG